MSQFPGGERDIRVSATENAAQAQSRDSSEGNGDSVHVDTTDCFEIEDLDDTGWEFITRPADPLPNGQ